MPVPYSSIFSALLNKAFGSARRQGLEYEIKETDKHIELIGTPEVIEAIRQMLSTVLSSQQAFKQALTYTFTPAQTDKTVTTQTTTTTETAPPPVETIPDVIQKLNNLFGAETFEEMFLNLNALFNTKARMEQGVAYSKLITQEKILASLNEQLEYLFLFFNNVSEVEIKAAWEGKKSLPRPNNSIKGVETTSVIARGILQECFGTILHKNPTTNEVKVELYFDVDKFQKILYPPTITPTMIASSEAGKPAQAKLTVDKDHFITHLRQLNGNAPLFHIYKSGEEVIANPLLFGADPVKPKERLYVFMIDRSGSMSDKTEHQTTLLQEAEENVIRTLEELQKLDNEAKVRIVFFDHKIGPSNDFSINDQAAIKAFVRAVNTDGGTDIFNTVTNQLDTVQKENSTEEKNITFFLFTDGKDGEPKNVANVDSKVTEFKQKKLTLPKIITMGYGKNYEVDTLTKLAELTNSPFTHVDTMAGLQQAMQDNIEHMIAESNLVEFLYETTNGQFRTQLPIGTSGITESDVRIHIPHLGEVKVEVAGQNYLLSVPDRSIVAPANTNDQLKDLAREARAIVHDETYSPTRVPTELNRILLAIKALPLVTETEKKLALNTLHEIETYQQQFGRNNPYYIRSARARARMRSNMGQSVAPAVGKPTTAQSPEGATEMLCENGQCQPAPQKRKILEYNEPQAVDMKPAAAEVPPAAEMPSEPQIKFTPSPQTSTSSRLEPFYLPLMAGLLRTTTHLAHNLATTWFSAQSLPNTTAPTDAQHTTQNAAPSAGETGTTQAAESASPSALQSFRKPALAADRTVLDLTPSDAEVVIVQPKVVAPHGKLTYVHQDAQVEVLDMSHNAIRGGHQNNFLTGDNKVDLDVSQSHGENIVIPGADMHVHCGPGTDHIAIMPNRADVTVHDFGKNDRLHIAKPVDQITTDGRSLCRDEIVDGKTSASIKTGDTTVHLPGQQCADLTAEQVKVNDPESFLNTLASVLAGPFWAPKHHYLIAAFIAAREEMLNYCARKIAGEDGVAAIAAAKKTPEYQTVAVAIEQIARGKAKLSVTLVHDILHGAKTQAKTNYAQTHSVSQAALAAGKGIFSVGFRYVATPVVNAAVTVVGDTYNGYKEKGLLGAIDKGADAAARYVIPGGSMIMDSLDQLEKKKPTHQQTTPLKTGKR